MTNASGDAFLNETDKNQTVSDMEFNLADLQELLDILKKLQEIGEFQNMYVIVVPVIFSIITVIGVIGNCLVLTVAYRNRTLRTINNRMIAFLAIADLVFLLICVPSTAVQYTANSYPFGEVWCTLSQYLIYTSAYVTIYLLCLMAIERFCAIVFPLKCRILITHRKMTIASFGIVVMAFLLNTPALFTHGLEPSFSKPSCGHYKYSTVFLNITLLQLHFALFQIFTYILPIIMFAILYGRILFVLSKRMKSNISTTMNTKSHLRAAKIVIILVLGFFICFTPIQVLIFLSKFMNIISLDNYIVFLSCQFAANALMYSNSCLNPILYTFLSREYRNSLKSVFRFGCLERLVHIPGTNGSCDKVTEGTSFSNISVSLKSINRSSDEHRLTA